MKRVVWATLLLAVGSAGPGAPVLARSVPVTVGDAVVIDPGVEVRGGADGTYTAVVDSAPLAAGDGVRTDATGFAEIAYLDGSRTRLDVSTGFEVVGLVDDAGASSTHTSMDIGRTWYRVKPLGEAGGGFSVDTSQATSTSRGAAFAIECVSAVECSYGVIDGSLELTLADGTVIALVAPSAVRVVSGVAGVVRQVPYDAVFGDSWLVDNAMRDAAAGFADPTTIFQRYGPAYASVRGTFRVTGTVAETTCTAACLDLTPMAGDPVDYSFMFEGGFDFDGSSYTFTTDSEQVCGVDDDGDGANDRDTGKMAASDVHTITPSAVEVRSGIPQVTAFTGTLTTTWTVASGVCFDGQFLGQTSTAAITGSR